MTVGGLRILAGVILAGLCAALAYGLYGELRRAPAAPAVVPLAQAAPAPPASEVRNNPVRIPALRTLSAMVERPLFFQERRRPEPEPEEPPKPAAEPALSITVTGVIITPKRSVALVRDPSSKETLHLSIGDRVGDWQVERIARDRIAVRWNDEVKEVVIEDRPPTPTPRTTNLSRRGPARMTKGRTVTPTMKRSTRSR